MKKISLIVVVSLLVFYTLGWFIAAKIAKDKILTTLEDLKTQKVINNYATTIKIRGFPFHFDMTLDSPSLQLSSSTPEGEYNMLHDGTIKIRLGLFSSSIKIITNGDLHLRGHVYKDKFYLLATGDESSYRIKLKKFLLSPSLIRNLANVKTSPETLLDIIDSVSAECSNVKIVNKINNNYVFAIDKGDLRTDFDWDKEKLQLKYRQDLVNAQFSEEALRAWSTLRKIPAINRIVLDLNPKIISYF